MMLNAHFEIQHEIGSGGMGTVVKGIDKQSGQPVAIKRLRPELIDPTILERFRREGEALRQLNHPNIVKFVDAFEDDGQQYLVLEFIEGKDLYDTIKQNPLDIRQITDIALDIADALTRAHRLNIIHRDIKPANILIGNENNVYLTDFGIASFGELSNLTETDGVIGTIPYLSPEVLEGKGVSEKSDIWAFGIVLYEMLTGERPFQGDHAGTLMRSILFDDVPDLEAITDGIPIALIDLIYRMLEKDPMFRIPSVRLVGVELEALKKGYIPYTPRQIKRDERTALGASRFSTPMQSRHTANNLPTALTPFVGREAELKEIERLLTNERLISIVAPGGMGKTRLALEAANRQLGYWRDGVYFVDLSSLSSPDAIPSKVAEATGFQFYEGAESRDLIVSFLSEKHMLLVMDNYEHVLEGADLVGDILKAAPNVTIITTSRERLRLHGETLFTVIGMDFPDWETPEEALEFAAVKLFMQSACRTNPAFELHNEDLQHIAKICRLMDGLPLGILLAASWVNMLSPEEIAAEIEQSIDFLETNQQNMPDRQRSIRVVFDYSWGQLSQHEQDVFAALSVFRGGFTREAVQEVTGANLRSLMTLVNQSMIARQPDGRYTIHELMRQYAADRLSQNQELEKESFDRHCRYYLEFMANYEEHLKSDLTGRPILSEIEHELENVIAASRYGAGHHFEDSVAAYLGSGKVYFWQGRYDDAMSTFEALRDLTHETDSRDAYADALCGIVKCYLWKGNKEDAIALLDKAEVAAHNAETRGPLANVLWIRAIMGYMSGDFELTLKLGDQLSGMAEEVNNQNLIAQGHNLLGAVNYARGNYKAAADHWTAQYELSLVMGQDGLAMTALNNIGVLDEALGDYETAYDHYQEALQLIDQTVIDQYMLFLSNLGGLQVRRGEIEDAFEKLNTVIDMSQDTPFNPLSETYRFLAEALLTQQKGSEALEAAQRALQLAENVSAPDMLAGAWRVLGQVASQLNEPVRSTIEADETLDAEQCFEKSEAICREHGLIGEQARTLHEWAHHELHSGNAARGSDLWKKARELFVKMGADLQVQRMDDGDVFSNRLS